MYIKVINPKTHGKNAYANTGSAAQVTNYLRKEALTEGGEAQFFTRQQEGVSGAEVTELLDNNVKGLRKDNAKFYSLVISPSPDELALIGSDADKLQAYTRRVMELYAAEFKLKDGRQLQAGEVMWAAVRHDARHYRSDEAQVQAGEAKAGEPKGGLQTHIHVLVSARDAQQKITLNPMGRADRFSMIDFAARSGAEFTVQVRLYNPAAACQAGPVPSVEALTATLRQAIGKRAPMPAEEQQQRGKRIEQRIEELRLLLPGIELDPGRVRQIGEQRQYDRTFYASLKRIEVRAGEGRPVEKPYTLLRTGSEKPHQAVARTASELGRSASRAGKAVERLLTPEQGSYTQDVSEKKDRGWDRER